MVWHLPPSACVHVTHGTWKMESKCEESEEVSTFWIKPRREERIRWREERKRKEMRRKKGKEKKKGNEKKKEKK